MTSLYLHCVVEKIMYDSVLIMKVFKVIDTLFLKFIEKRISDDWNTSDLKGIRAWIQS